MTCALPSERSNTRAHLHPVLVPENLARFVPKVKRRVFGNERDGVEGGKLIARCRAPELFAGLSILFAFTCCSGALGIPVVSLHDKMEAISSISGFHSSFNSDKSLEVRLLEESGVASVARNPIYLYVVITNNGSDDYFSKVWKLPYRVEKVEKLEVAGNRAKITVQMLEGEDNPGLQRRTITLAWKGKGDNLEDSIQVEKEK